jgi:hypothetical protein
MGTRPIESWLTILADPLGVNRAAPDGLLAEEWRSLFEMADAHGVLPTVVQGLKSRLRQTDASRLLISSQQRCEPSILFDQLLATSLTRMRQLAAFTSLLRIRSDEVQLALGRAGVPAMVIKGADFAYRLYPRSCLRPFRDIDLLVPRRAIERAEDVLEALGYRREAEPTGKYQGEYGEASWRHSGPVPILLELHWNLVNSPAQRRVVSLSYEDLQRELLQCRGVSIEQPSSAAILLIASVHAALGHRFDRLQMLCDICQASREVAGPIDTDWLTEAATRTGGGMSLRMGLRLAERLFDEPACAQLSRRLRLAPVGHAWKLLLDQSLVLRSQSTVNKLRRQGIREVLKRAA